MAARMNEILIVGGTTGIGEQFARRFHSLGKKVIVTGRNGEKLGNMEKELEGLATKKVCELLSRSSFIINKLSSTFPTFPNSLYTFKI